MLATLACCVCAAPLLLLQIGAEPAVRWPGVPVAGIYEALLDAGFKPDAEFLERTHRQRYYTR